MSQYEYLAKHPAAHSSTLTMPVANGGRLRTKAEFLTLLAAADFRLMNTIPTQVGRTIIEGVRS